MTNSIRVRSFCASASVFLARASDRWLSAVFSSYCRGISLVASENGWTNGSLAGLEGRVFVLELGKPACRLFELVLNLADRVALSLDLAPELGRALSLRRQLRRRSRFPVVGVSGILSVEKATDRSWYWRRS